MTNQIAEPLDPLTNVLRRTGWSIAALIMLLPLAGGQFDEGVNWTFSDYVFAAAMLGGVGIALELVVRTHGSWAYRIASVIALGTMFVTVWGNLAVGFIGSEDNPVNGLFFLVLPVPVLGSALALFRPRGMYWSMAATAAAQVAVGIVIAADIQTPEIFIVTLVFTAAWLTSAALFHKASLGPRTD